MKITSSMQKMIEETKRRRNKQLQYNKDNNITPATVKKPLGLVLKARKAETKFYVEPENTAWVSDPLLHIWEKMH